LVAEQRVHDLGVNGRLAVRRNGRLDHHPGYLMSESKIISILDQQTVTDQLIHDKRILNQRHQQLRRQPGTNRRSGVEHTTSRRSQGPRPGQDGITNRRRQGVTAALQYFGNEEGVAGGQPV